MLNIAISVQAGTFAENKDIAKKIRERQILPALKKGEQEIILDFVNVTGATQSFVHALISEAIREHGDEVFNKLLFKNCSPAVRQVVNIVADYREES
jgi:hypothetical protein